MDDTRRIMPKAPIRNHYNRGLGDMESNFSGSMDLSVDGKPRIEHIRVDDLSLLEEEYKIGKKLGQ